MLERRSRYTLLRQSIPSSTILSVRLAPVTRLRALRALLRALEPSQLLDEIELCAKRDRRQRLELVRAERPIARWPRQPEGVVLVAREK